MSSQKIHELVQRKRNNQLTVDIKSELAEFKNTELFNYIQTASSYDVSILLHNASDKFLTKLHENYNSDQIGDLERQLMNNELEDIIYNSLRTSDNPLIVIDAISKINKLLVTRYISSVCVDKATFLLAHLGRNSLEQICNVLNSEIQFKNAHLVLRKWDKLAEEGCQDIPKRLIEIASKNLN